MARPTTPSRKPETRPRQPRGARNPSQRPQRAIRLPASTMRRFALVGLEMVAWLFVGLIGTIKVLGHAGDWFGGTDLTASLLPFAGTVLILALSASLLLSGWLRLRGHLNGRRAGAASGVALLAALLVAGYTLGTSFRQELAQLRRLVGGTEQAARIHIGHQVYARYRRSDLAELQKLIERAAAYEPIIQQAAHANRIDQEILTGIAATESSFLPRDSHDGGRGLFQITAPPRVALLETARAFAVSEPDPLDHTQNAYLAAATLNHYLGQMRGDLFLGLLAYNMGPRNGGLLSIMEQYGARDFFTIQPYLKNLPRDYPIRVLTAALAFRLWRTEGFLPRYEEGLNARHIQEIGIPGLQG